MAIPNVNQITSTLRSMPDQQLQQYAAMHKADPYILSLAVAESNDRKAVRASQQAKMAGQQQPTVADQSVAQMAPQPDPQQMAQQQLPEQQGIGALPAPNMQRMADGGIAGYDDTQEQLKYNNEPVLLMADGGVARFDKGGLALYQDQIVSEAKRLGIDPQVALNLFKTESGGDKNAVSGKGAAGLGQLMKPAAQEMGLSEEERFDPQKNIKASLGYFKKQLDRFGSYDKAAAAYNWGPGNVNKHLAKNEGILDRLSLPKETANYLTKLMPGRDANAGELDGRGAAPQAQATGEKGDARGAGKAVGLGTLAGTMGAGMSIPVAESAKAIYPSGTTARQAFTQMGRAASVPAAVGFGGLQASGVARNNLELMSPEQRQEMAENPMLSAMSGDTGFAGAIMNAGQAEKDQSSQMPYWDQMKNAFGFIGNTVVGRPGYGVSSAVNGTRSSDAPKATVKPMPKYDATTEAEDASYGAIDRTPPKVDLPKTDAAAPTEKKSRFTDDDLLMLGLGMMANNKPGTGNKFGDLLASAGQAGIGAVAAKREREKSDREDLYRQALGREANAKAKVYESNVGGSAVTAQALKGANDMYDNWLASLDKMAKMKLQENPGLAQQKQQEFLRQSFAAFKIPMPAELAGGAPAAASQSDPLGILGR